MVIKEFPDCLLEYEESLHCVVQHWRGYSKSDQFHEVILKTLDFFTTEPGATAIISDTRNHKVVRTSDADWVAKEINPQLIGAGLQKMAFVLPEDQFAALSVGHFTKVSDTFEIGNFEDIESARAWVQR